MTDRFTVYNTAGRSPLGRYTVLYCDQREIENNENIHSAKRVIKWREWNKKTRGKEPDQEFCEFTTKERRCRY
jgi:hypothetical protein